MKIKSQSYPDRIRSMATDLSRMRISPEVDSSAEKLRAVADELEHHLRKALERKS